MPKRTKSLHNILSYLVCLVMALLSAISSEVRALPAGNTTPPSADSTTATSDAGKVQTDVHTVSTDMVPIMTLLLNHDKIRFTMENIPGGERTITTSKDLGIVKAIRLHAREMRARVHQGNNIRPNDPIFVEIFRRHKEISDTITDIPNGVSEEETSHNPQVVLLIRAHAKTVAGFVQQGLAATHQNTPLPKGYHSGAGGATAGGH